jgi:beta-galactosidase
MKLGVAYYPEHHPAESWPGDFEKLREAGLERIRVGEFAWSRLEPSKGEYQWEWLDRSLEMAGEYGLEVVLCTPTACPPIWLVEEHPDILPVDRMGRRASFGARQHRCYNAPAYHDATRAIVGALGERYGKHPSVVAWQLDNEFCGEKKRCYCDHCRLAFQQYLAEKYLTVDALNERWGNYFWSQDYQRFDQVVVPRTHAAELMMKHHPSLELEFTRFSSDSIVRYARMQTDILRPLCPGREITTNTDDFKWGDTLNLVDLFEQLDVAAIDLYKDDAYEIGFYCDLMRGTKAGVDRFWLTEFTTQSKDLYRDLTQVAQAGCEWLLLFKANAFPSGQEQGTRALLTITGQPTPAYRDAAKWNREEHCADVTEPLKAGLYYHFDSAWTFSIDTWDEDPEAKQIYGKYVVHTVYRAMFEALGAPLQVVLRPEDIDSLELLVLPMQSIHDEALEQRLIDFVTAGGKLIVTPELFQKNADNVYLSRVPDIYRRLLGLDGSDFIYPDWCDGGFVLRNGSCGKGQTWMVRSDGDLGDWKRLLEAVSGE